MKKSLLLTTLLFFIGILIMNAQTKHEIQIGLASPTSDFADDDEDDAISRGSGVAGTGLYIGYKSLKPMKTEGLYRTLNAGIMYNGLQSDFKDDLDDDYDPDDASYPNYLNIPLLVGLQYEKSIENQTSVFGEVALGFNMLKITNWTMEDDYDLIKYVFKPSVKIGYKIGGGVLLQDKYVIGLTYYGLGSHKVKYEYEYESDYSSDSDDDKFEKPLSISSLNIMVGMRF